DRRLSSDVFACEVVTHIIRAGGKRLRPTLLLLCAQFGQTNPSVGVVLATAVEWLHTATLYHDDILDEAEARRHRVAVNRMWGNRIAAFGGNLLYARAAEEFAKAGDTFNRCFSAAVLSLWQGQMFEIMHAFDYELDETQYLDIIQKK